jgi:protease-4
MLWALFASRWAAALSFPLRALRARRLIRPGTFVALTIDGPVVELPERRPWFRRGAAPATALADVRELVAEMLRDPRVSGLVVEIRSLRAGAATATSLREALARLHAGGKTVVAYLPSGAGSREMLVASAAERIIVGPQSSISPLGVAVETRYFRRTLDRIGVLPEIFARGEFKTAGESLARDSMSAEQREQLGAILDVWANELLGALSRGRQRSMEQARVFLDNGPYRAVDAVASGLVDDTGYDDEVPSLATGQARPRLLPWRAFHSVRRGAPKPRRVGVIHVRGPIVSRAPLSLGRMAVDERIVGALRAAGSARSLAGVVLLIDSPGGSVLASDRIHHEVVRLAEKKPVVAYLGNIAASGGYYVAAGAHAIVAQPSTITGSIGVVAAHLVLSPLLEKLGIVTELLKRGARADMLSTSRPLDDGERRALGEEIDGYYRDFVAVVAKGRRRPPEEIEKLARGRVYSGLEAERVGLVDRLGGLDVAVEMVREKAGESGEMGCAVVKPPRTTPKPPEIPAPLVEVMDRLAGSPALEMVELALGLAPAERVLAYDFGLHLS